MQLGQCWQYRSTSIMNASKFSLYLNGLPIAPNPHVIPLLPLLLPLLLSAATPLQRLTSVAQNVLSV